MSFSQEAEQSPLSPQERIRKFSGIALQIASAVSSPIEFVTGLALKPLDRPVLRRFVENTTKTTEAIDTVFTEGLENTGWQTRGGMDVMQNAIAAAEAVQSLRRNISAEVAQYTDASVATIEPVRNGVVDVVHKNIKRSIGSFAGLALDFAFGGPAQALFGLPLPVVSDLMVKSLVAWPVLAAIAPALPWIVGGVAGLGLISGAILFARGRLEARSLNSLIIQKAKDGDVSGYKGYRG